MQHYLFHRTYFVGKRNFNSKIANRCFIKHLKLLGGNTYKVVSTKRIELDLLRYSDYQKPYFIDRLERGEEYVALAAYDLASKSYDIVAVTVASKDNEKVFIVDTKVYTKKDALVYFQNK
jgi:hypothetical protein